MGQVTITVNGRKYQISCDDGQEDHLRGLAELVDGRVAELVAAVGQVGDTRLVVMASLLLADEVSLRQREIDRISAKSDGLSKNAATARDGMADKLDSLADRVESMTARLKQA